MVFTIYAEALYFLGFDDWIHLIQENRSYSVAPATSGSLPTSFPTLCLKGGGKMGGLCEIYEQAM
jgi:hypothetical protein